jgi:hypothetical protein
MDDATLETHFENLDQRLSRLEQIVPTLATKDDLAAFATKDDLAAFATKDDLAAFATKEDLAAFATKGELRVTEARLRQEIREEADQTRRHMTILLEHQDSKIRLIAEHLLSLMPRRE